MANFDFEVEGLDGTDGAGDQPDAQAQAASAAAAATVDGLYEQPAAEERQDQTEDAEMLAVEERLHLAQYYQLMMVNSFFNDDSELAQRVDKEIRAFVRGRLQVLMGVKAEAAAPVKQRPPDFTESQVGALKMLADRTLAMAQKMNATAKPPPPAPVAPPPPSIRKVDVKPPAQVPEVRRPAAPPQLRPQPQLQVKPALAQRKPGQPPPRPPNAKVLSRFATTQAQAPSIDLNRVPEKYRDDPTLVERNGRLWVQARTPNDEPLWECDLRTKQTVPMLKDVTLPAAPGPTDIQPTPMPFMGTGSAGLSSPFAQVMEQQNGQLLALAEKRTSAMGIGGHLAATLVTNLSPNGE